MQDIDLSKYNSPTLRNRVKSEVRYLIDTYPRIYLPLIRLKKQSAKLAPNDETKIVIEGYPRSANSFAVGAFRSVQPEPLHIANHLHCAASIIYACQNNIPCIALIRNPVDAIISLRSLDLQATLVKPERRPHCMPFKMMLKKYIKFYSQIKPYNSSFIVGLFEDVTRDFGKIILRANKKYNTDFIAYENVKENNKKVFEKHGYHAGPNDIRNKIKKIVQEEFDSQEKLGPLINDAQSLYREFIFIAQEQSKLF